MTVSPQLMTGEHIQDIKDTLGITLLDLHWVTGIKSFSSPKEKWKMTGERAKIPIPTPSLTLLIRYLLKHGDEGLLPRMPSGAEVWETILPYCKDVPEIGDPSLAKFGLLLGVGQGGPTDWRHAKRSPRLGIQRLLYLLNTIVKKDGARALQRYCEVVTEEARARGIDGIPGLFEDGSWHSETFAAKYQDPNVPVPEGLITNYKLNSLKETLGLVWWDFIWLTGRASYLRKWKVHGEELFRPKVHPTTCILVRYLLRYFEDSYAPEFPTYFDIIDTLEQLQVEANKQGIEPPFKKITGRQIGPLFGISGWGLNQYKNGRNKPSPMVSHLFFILKKVIERKGRKGFDQYFNVVKEEILARELGDYENVVKSGWASRAFKKKYYS